MTDLPDPGTDPVPEEGAEGPYGFFARLVGMPEHDQRMDRKFARLEELLTSPVDTAALAEALETLRSTDVKVKNIEPGTPGAKATKKGTKP